jgi:hypothetical protein
MNSRIPALASLVLLWWCATFDRVPHEQSSSNEASAGMREFMSFLLYAQGMLAPRHSRGVGKCQQIAE